MKQKTELRQKLIITQSLQQYLGILQMSNVELEEKIEKELESNPLLEIKEQENNNHDVSHYNKPLSSGVDSEVYENIEDSGISIEEFLRRQLFLKFEDEISRKIGSEIIQSINEAGYLTKSTADITRKLHVKLEEVEHVLSEMQKFDPSGIFARNLAECITIQLKEMGLFNKKIECVLEHIELLGKGKHSEVARLCEITKERLDEIYKIIRKTNPKPLADFNTGKKNAVNTNGHIIKPDVILFKNDYNEWVIELADDFSKRLQINSGYKLIIKNLKSKDKRNEELSEKLKDATFLIKGIEKRNETIIRVAYEILKLQKDFFEKGDDIEIRTLKLSDLAKNLNLHISTISRTVNKKYMLTPFGTYELKYFFSTGVNRDNNNENHPSRKKMMKIIKNLVNNEKDKSMVMSDDKIKDILTGMGYGVSRRAIAKYREVMNIPNSNVRKNSMD